MTTCPACSKGVPAESLSCPSCGAPIDDSVSATRLLPDEPPPATRTGTRPEARARHTDSIHTSTSTRSIDDARFVPGVALAERYRIISLLGRGGMGEVYRADDLKLGQPVALKFLPASLSQDEEALGRLYREVRVARQISHPNVCRVYDVGETEGQHFLSMEYIRGEELASTLRRFGRLPADKAAEIARQVCAGLAAAHKTGILHRDLKPANVMIDDAGNALITDFGLAALAEEIRGNDAYSGTPAYMSPEQLSGAELTPRSDIYSLGVVLYELFTGKRAFEAATLPELIRLRQSDAAPASPSSLVKDLDPVVERVILRCLERDPERRPPSALQVAAALPGGDPLAAALAMGETPSPEMVAAAAKEGALRPWVAAALAAAVLVGLALAVLLSGKVMLHRHAALEKPPEALGVRAAEVIRKLGYTEQPADRAYGFGRAGDYLQYVEAQDRSPARWDKLVQGPWSPLYFWYRQSPRRLDPWDADSLRATAGDPPPLVSGMAGVSVDPAGRLLRFYAVPPQIDESQTPTQPPDWSVAFAEAGLDFASFKPATPKWVPFFNSDSRAAWEGGFAGQAATPVRVEAASFRGRPVYFEVLGPWAKPTRMQPPQADGGGKIVQAIFLILLMSVIIAGVLLARHNLLVGRGDRRGAFRLGVFVFASFMVSWLLRADHAMSADGEFGLFIKGTEFALFITALVWLFYVSLEPFVRRRTPQRIISWSRLLVGEWRDPLVGRDVLVGAAFGTAMGLLSFARLLAPRWVGLAPAAPLTPQLETLLGLREVLGYFFYIHLTQTIFVGLGFLFLFLLLNIVLRREWLAAAVFFLLLTANGLTQGHTLATGLVFDAALAALVIFVALRFGLLATIAALFFDYLCTSYPFTSDLSAWYAAPTLFAAIVAVALAGYGFYTSLAGQPLFKKGLLGD
ncbi:MAG: serine/threonine protein kinase [Acidobacteria bacterium]|nr:serine/threonine protein kinase [Acidobacteriota bacterium]